MRLPHTLLCRQRSAGWLCLTAGLLAGAALAAEPVAQLPVDAAATAVAATPSTTPSAAPVPAAAAALPDTALPPEVLAALSTARVPAEALSALVMPVDERGPERLRHRVNVAVNPASVMKLVTTYAAMDLLGPDFTWSTRFYTDGTVDGQGGLRGNLYIRGGGDPKLVLERLQAAFTALQAKGVRVVLGDLVLDHSAFDVAARDADEFDGEGLRPYNASPDALLVNFKSVILNFEPDARAGVARVVSEPPMAGLAIDATVPLGRGACGAWREQLGARFDDANTIRFGGRFPKSCGPQVWPVAYQDPQSYAARALEGLWRASGGLITGQVKRGITPPGARLLLDAPSLPLQEVITDVNQWSNNVMAQQVFLTLGRLTPTQVDEAKDTLAPKKALQPIRTAAFERSREVVARWWRATFARRLAPPVLENGSGLSRNERITPAALAGMLRHAANHANGEGFVQSLSVAGIKGTAARIGRDPNSPVHGNAWLKTGTLRDVTGVAGYVNGADGQRYVVVGFVNHPNAVAARAALEVLVEWSAR